METGQSSTPDRSDRLFDEAQTYQANGEYDRAEQLYSQSADIAKNLGDQRRIATSLEGLAESAEAQGKVDKAQPLFEQSAGIYHMLAENAKAQGHSDSAQVLEERSNKIQERLIADRGAEPHGHVEQPSRQKVSGPALLTEGSQRKTGKGLGGLLGAVGANIFSALTKRGDEPVNQQLQDQKRQKDEFPASPSQLAAVQPTTEEGSAPAIGVRPHEGSPNQDGLGPERQQVFRMEQDGFYDHLYIKGFLVQSSFEVGGWAYQQYGVAAGMHIRTHKGGIPYFFSFNDFPKNTWASVYDNKGNPLPFAVYVQDDVGVYGKWLRPQLPPT